MQAYPKANMWYSEKKEQAGVDSLLLGMVI
jgi:hypothetical protein